MIISFIATYISFIIKNFNYYFSKSIYLRHFFSLDFIIISGSNWWFYDFLMAFQAIYLRTFWFSFPFFHQIISLFHHIFSPIWAVNTYDGYYFHVATFSTFYRFFYGYNFGFISCCVGFDSVCRSEERSCRERV